MASPRALTASSICTNEVVFPVKGIALSENPYVTWV